MKYQMYPFWEMDYFRLIISKAANKVKHKICNLY